MLQRGEGAAALDALDDGSGEDTAEQRVLGEALEAAAVERSADDVDGGAEPYVGALCLALARQELAGGMDEVRVPCRAEARAARDAEGRDGVEEARAPGTVGAVCALDGGDVV